MELNRMTKPELLKFLAQARSADAFEVARVFDLSYAAAAMALLRFTRQGLVVRRLDPEKTVYWYALSEHGEKRLAYFEALEPLDD
jgi:DNA-binding MarR family transcriptional regulator